MRSTNLSVNDYLKGFNSSDFVIGKDGFESLKINHVEDSKGFYFFKDTSKPLSRYVRRFILKNGKLSQKACVITLIKNKNNKFEPRFEFIITDLTKNAVTSSLLKVEIGEDRLIKARVDLNDCHEELSQLMAYLSKCEDIELSDNSYSVITNDQKVLLDRAIDRANKVDVMVAVAEKYGHSITDKDINIITKRKNALERFKKLLTNSSYFNYYQTSLEEKGMSHRREDVWQHFFENNTWIFGYGLYLVSCESLDDKKLETIVVGSDLFDGAGKRIDGLLKTKGSINRALFIEIKLHDTSLLEKYSRSAVWVPGEDLRGGVAQMQKSLHKVELKITENFQTIRDKEGNPTGENIAFVKPRGIVLIGQLNQFSTDNGFNDEKFSSFELYRQQLTGIEVITYDELYERARFIIEDK